MHAITILQPQFTTRLGGLAAMIFSLGSIASAGSSFCWTSPWVVSIEPHCTGNLFPFPGQCLGSRGFVDSAPPESIRCTEDEHAVAWMQSGGRPMKRFVSVCMRMATSDLLLFAFPLAVILGPTLYRELSLPLRLSQ